MLGIPTRGVQQALGRWGAGAALAGRSMAREKYKRAWRFVQHRMPRPRLRGRATAPSQRVARPAGRACSSGCTGVGLTLRTGPSVALRGFEFAWTVRSSTMLLVMAA